MKLILEVLKFLLIEKIDEYSDILGEPNFSQDSIEEKRQSALKLLEKIK